jgi:DnaJ-like protein
MAAIHRDPERPDPAEPSRERVRETFVERRIRAAMDEGAFDDLPHQGRRLPLDDDSLAGEWAMAHHVLRNAGAAPPWIEADKVARGHLQELDRVLSRAPILGDAARTRARTDVVRIVEAANRAISRLNVEAPTEHQHRRLLSLEVALARFDRAVGVRR